MNKLFVFALTAMLSAKAFASAPVINHISPNSGPESISPYPTISGSNFQTTTVNGVKVIPTVKVGGVKARGAWIGGTTSLVFEPPYTAVTGPVSVEVINPDGTSVTLANGWTYTTASLPNVTAQPTSLTVNTGSSAMFKVSATGLNITYQWRKNGANITGATSNTYTIATTTTANAGTYDVVVSNTLGTATSGVATLTVNLPTTIAVSPSQVNGGGTVTVQVQGGPGAPKNFVELYQVLGTCGNYACWTWIGYQFLNGTETAPTTGVTSATLKFAMPNTAGTYAFYFRYDPSTTTHITSSYVKVLAATNPTPTPTPVPTATPSKGVDNFPRLANISIGGPQKYSDPTFQAFAAKSHFMIMGSNWEGWEKGRGYTRESVIQAIKKASTVNTRVFIYVNLNEVSTTIANNPMPTWATEVLNNNWLLHNVGSGGAFTADWQDTNKDLTDMSPNMSTSGGLTPYQWGAKFVNDYFHLGLYSTNTAAPSLDGFFLDNVFVDPYVDGDWTRGNSTELRTSATAQNAVMSGEAQFYSYLRSVWPAGTQIGNSGDGVAEAVDSGWSIAPLNQQLAGSVLEHAIGKSYSTETWLGAIGMQRRYTSAINSLSGPKLMLFSHGSMSATGVDPVTYTKTYPQTPVTYSPEWQGARYGITACLMNNGYYGADAGTYDIETPANRLWFDEYDGGGIGVGYLGQPLNDAAGDPQSGAWSGGVWKREFEHGIVLWNPKGNGSRTVSLYGLGNLKRINGQKNKTTNSGATVTGGNVILGDRDGLVLLRY